MLAELQHPSCAPICANCHGNCCPSSYLSTLFEVLLVTSTPQRLLLYMWGAWLLLLLGLAQSRNSCHSSCGLLVALLAPPDAPLAHIPPVHNAGVLCCRSCQHWSSSLSLISLYKRESLEVSWAIGKHSYLRDSADQCFLGETTERSLALGVMPGISLGTPLLSQCWAHSADMLASW